MQNPLRSFVRPWDENIWKLVKQHSAEIYALPYVTSVAKSSSSPGRRQMVFSRHKFILPDREAANRGSRSSNHRVRRHTSGPSGQPQANRDA